MNNKLDVLGVAFVGLSSLFCGVIFYWIFSDINASLAAKIGFSSFWLLLSFMFIVYSLGIARGEDRTKIQVPKGPAICIFSIVGILLLVAVFVNAGL